MKQGPVRTCVGCGTKKRIADLVRFTTKDGIVLLDKDRKLGGRGWHLCYNIRCAFELFKKRKTKRVHSVRREILKSIVKDFESEVFSECPGN